MNEGDWEIENPFDFDNRTVAKKKLMQQLAGWYVESGWKIDPIKSWKRYRKKQYKPKEVNNLMDSSSSSNVRGLTSSSKG